MCGRYAITLPPEAVRQWFRTHGDLPNWPAYYNAAPTSWVYTSDLTRKAVNDQNGKNESLNLTWQALPKHKLWGDDPIMLPYRQAARSGRFAGYQGPSTRKAAEVVTKYIIIDMYAKAVQGMPAEEAVKWAHGELLKIYGT